MSAVTRRMVVSDPVRYRSSSALTVNSTCSFWALPPPPPPPAAPPAPKMSLTLGLPISIFQCRGLGVWYSLKEPKVERGWWWGILPSS